MKKKILYAWLISVDNVLFNLGINYMWTLFLLLDFCHGWGIFSKCRESGVMKQEFHPSFYFEQLSQICTEKCCSVPVLFSVWSFYHLFLFSFPQSCCVLFGISDPILPYSWNTTRLTCKKKKLSTQEQWRKIFVALQSNFALFCAYFGKKVIQPSYFK